MSTITEYYKQAELALAAYSTLSAGISGSPYTNALKAEGMTDAQASAFSDKWSVVTQYNDADTGLSATVFQEVATGKRYLAIRGTEFPSDFVNDVFLADGGILLHGIPALSGQYQSLHAKVVEWQGNGVLSGNYTVSGHSLGGWLAQGLALDFINVQHAYVYNAPGVFGGLLGDALQRLNTALGTTFLDPPSLSNVTSLRASEGFNLIAGLGQALATPIGIRIEDQTQPDITDPAGSRNHSQRVLVDALALYAMFARIAPTASVESITKIIESASAQNGNTLETTLDALRTLFQQTYQYGQLDYDAVPTPLGNSAVERDAYYTNLQSLQTWWDASPFTALSIKPLAELSGSQIAAAAMADTPEGAAYRYAIYKLNPFAVTGSSALYDGINTHGELTRYNPATGTGALTDQYLKDRAAMLSWQLQFGTNDTEPVGDTFVKLQSGTPFYFEDFTSNAITTKMRIGGGDTASSGSIKAPPQATLQTALRPLSSPSGSHCAASRSSRRVPLRRYTSGANPIQTPVFPATSPRTPALRARQGRFVSPVQGVCPRPHWKRTQFIDRQSINSIIG